MRRTLLLAILYLLPCSLLFAQDVAEQCSRGKISSFGNMAKVTAASPEEEHYDIKHVHLDIELDNTSVDIRGNVTTTAVAKQVNFVLYVFELNKRLTVDSVLINGEVAKFRQEGDIVNSFCPEPLQPGTVFKAQVFYHGSPEPGTVFAFQSGMNNAEAAQWNSPVTYTQSEPFNSKDWWPCKQSLTDKIDSADIWITVPDTLMAGSNGVLQRVTEVPGNKARYEWKTHYPMAYYLVSAAVAAYQEYNIHSLLPDGTVVPIQNFIYNRPGALAEYKRGIDTVAIMMNYFSELFGRYPFYKEKYGHCMSPLFGGMEHQTMTTQQHFGAKLTAHELAHQWFGNQVTCAGWQDIWLNEGFASYAEYLYAEKYWGATSAYNYMQRVHSLVLEDSLAVGSIYKYGIDTQNVYIIFNTTLTYNKSSAVVHTLRYFINNDELFFRMLRTYQTRFSMGNATTEDFQRLAEEETGIWLGDFFKQWIYGKGYPEYNIKWNQTGDNLWVELEQQTSQPDATPLFTIPIEIKLSSAHGDTTIKVDMNTAQKSLKIVTKKKIDAIVIDPRNMILNKDSVVRNYDMGSNIIAYPNPTGSNWKITNLVTGTILTLTDLNGKVLLQTTAPSNRDMTIEAAQYAKGIYLLQVTGADEQKKTIKLTKL